MKKNLAAYVLAGGKSSRMGQDKGLLLFKGKPMVVHVLDSLKEITSQITIVSNQSGYESLGYEVIADKVKEIGPIGGVYTALYHTQSEKNIIVACDTPLVSADLWRNLCENGLDNQVVVFSLNGNAQPLFGIYDKNILPKVEKMIESKVYKMQNLIAESDSKVLPLEDFPALNSIQMFNINTPQELENI